MTYLNEYLTLEISETERVAVYQSEDYHPWEDYLGDTLGVFVLERDRYLSDFSRGEHTDSLHSLLNRIDHSQYESAVGKYLSLAGLHYTRLSLRGYSQGDWAEVIIYGDDTWATSKETAESVKSWFRGDIYDLAHEKLLTFTSEDSDRVIKSWEVLDSIHGVMLESYEDTKDFAKSDFGITL